LNQADARRWTFRPIEDITPSRVLPRPNNERILRLLNGRTLVRTLARSLMLVTIAVAASSGPTIAQTPPPPGPRTVLWALTQADLSCGLGVQPDAIHPLGDPVTIRNGCSGNQTVYQRDGFWTVALASGAERDKRILGSGTYLSAVVPGEWHAPIRVLPKAPAAPPTNSFTVRWADNAAPTTWRYGLQYRIGQGDWRVWKSGTALRTAVFNGLNGRTYFFRARTVRVAGKATDWSPARKVVT
jgi:hypothetical protein